MILRSILCSILHSILQSIRPGILRSIQHSILHSILCSILHSILRSIQRSILCSILCSILHSILEQEVLVLYILILLLPPAGVISMILRSILSSISEARGASFVCFNTSAVSIWGQRNDSA